MVTDPPYGVGYDPDWRNRDWVGARSVGTVSNDDQADWSLAWQHFPGDVAYTWSAPGNNLIASGQALLTMGFDLRTQIIWRKQHFAISRGHYHYQHEPCWYAVRQGAKAHWTGDRKQSTVWDITNASAFGGDNEDSATNHSTQKPVECMRRPMQNHNAPEVYDPFVGSGTTLIAAETLGRSCFAMDIDPTYVDIALARWERFTGKKAERID